MALASLMNDRPLSAAPENARLTNPFAPQQGHFPAKAKNVIFLFMAGGPSQLDLFDYKPKLQEMDGQVIPDSYVKNKRFAFIKLDDELLLGTRGKFAAGRPVGCPDRRIASRICKRSPTTFASSKA